MCFSFDSAFKTIDAQMTFWSVFLKTHYQLSKSPFWPFLAIINFVQCIVLTKTIFVHLLFLMLKQREKNKSQLTPKKARLRILKQKPFFRGSKIKFLKLQFRICFSVFFLLCKRKHHADFQKKYEYLGPLEIFENENFATRAENFDLDF